MTARLKRRMALSAGSVSSTVTCRVEAEVNTFAGCCVHCHQFRQLQPRCSSWTDHTGTVDHLNVEGVLLAHAGVR
jgi:hypothetical protein